MTEAELNISNEELLSKLKLLSNGKLKRSAVLLFYGDPSIFPGAEECPYESVQYAKGP